MSTTCVYVIAAFDLIKVGTSRDPERRARALTGQLRHMIIVPEDSAPDAEAYAHDRLAPYRESSEWFKCDEQTAIDVLKETGSRLSAGLSLKPVDGLADRKRGLVKASQRRADNTIERLKIALPLWRDQNFTVKEISKRCGLSAHTLYDYLPPRFTKE